MDSNHQLRSCKDRTLTNWVIDTWEAGRENWTPDERITGALLYQTELCQHKGSGQNRTDDKPHLQCGTLPLGYRATSGANRTWTCNTVTCNGLANRPNTNYGYSSPEIVISYTRLLHLLHTYTPKSESQKHISPHSYHPISRVSLGFISTLSNPSCNTFLTHSFTSDIYFLVSALAKHWRA